MDDIGYLYENGTGVDRNYAEALRWYREGANHGNENAMTGLGYLYENGLGVARDARAAVNWYRKAVDNGSGDGMVGLAYMLAQDEDIEPDSAQAADLMVRALKLGNESALEQMTTNSDAWGADFRRNLQGHLNRQGVYNGAVDGIFNFQTVKAIRQIAGEP